MPHVIAPSRRYLVATGTEVEEGEVVEVDDVTYASLVEQGWEPAHDQDPDPEPSKAPPRARTKPAAQAENEE